MSQILLFLVYPSVLFYSLKVTGLTCRQERSKRGFALFYKNYSSSFKDDYPECVSLCVNDPNCMSLNYWLNSKKCELNTHSRETCPAYFMQASSIYMGMARYPGDKGACTVGKYKQEGFRLNHFLHSLSMYATRLIGRKISCILIAHTMPTDLNRAGSVACRYVINSYAS